MNSRRDFLRQSGAAALGGLLVACASAPPTRRAPVNTAPLRVGLIGCGGRGTGAAAQALKADPNVRLTAMGDAFADHLDESLKNLQLVVPGQVAVTPGTSFIGLDAYQRVIDSGVDVVLLATPPGFRPQHLRAAVVAGKHVFCEKPVAVDAPGVRSVLASAAEAKTKNLAIVSGFCWRYHDAIRESMRRVHRGAVGEIRAIQGTYYGNTLSTKFTGERQPDWSDLEWQLRNWAYFQWLSGDHLVEQAVHNVDKIAWAMGDRMPVSATATGGRQVPVAYGNIYDHFHVNYEYANGVRAFLDCRQQDNVHAEVTDYVMGNDGVLTLGRGPVPGISGRRNWQYSGTARDMYQAEHDELFASIRAGTPINDGVSMAHSTLMAIMGRMAAYTGQSISWEQALNSQESLMPAALDWGMALPVAPYAVPGVTAFA